MKRGVYTVVKDNEIFGPFESMREAIKLTEGSFIYYPYKELMEV